MNIILELLLTLTVAGSAVVACILVLRIIPIHAFPTKWRYGISKMAVGFYLLPVVLGMQWSSPLVTFNATATVPIMNELPSTVQHALPNPYSRINPVQLIPEQTISANVARPLIILWAIGAIAFAAWQMYCYRRFLKKLEHTRTTVSISSEAAKQLPFIKEALGLKSNVRLAYSSIIRSPVLVGLWKPTIYLPIENTVNVDMVIRHELIHLKRKDLWVKAFTLGASAIHWFNPLVHILRKDIHIWSELSCDEEVVKEMSYPERKRYGETILSVMAGSRNLPVQFCASLSGDGKQLKRRLMMMLNVKKQKKKTLYLTITAVFLVAVISTSAAAWASSNTPKVIGNEGSHSEAQPNEVAPEAAPSDAVVENEGNDVEAEPSEEAPSVPVVENETNDAETQPEEARPVPVAENKTITESQGKETVAAPKNVGANEKSGAESQVNEEPALLVDDGYRKSHPNEIPPGTSITVRSMTPEERASMKELEEELRATLTPEELAEYDHEYSHPNEIPPGTSITVRSMTPEERASMKETEEELRETLTPEELAEYDFDK
ncbi:M56 family metallopeptidase [Paenibacillus sp. ISL-20]|uniref:M56 family metallopeptidase n=1 Tax=Paenibacillus sp. ISL-20 TaxID=2819163 RepID=UPI001BEAEDFB|nr:peptidase M56 [Paenibacillus sp. ISL-20]